MVFVGLVAGPMLSTLPAGDYYASAKTWSYVGLNMVLFTVHKLPGVFTILPYSHSVNSSLWTLPIEVTMYASTLVLVPAVLWRPRLVMPAMVVAVFAALFVVVRHPWALRPISEMQLYSFRLYGGLSYMSCYLIGMLFAFTGADRMTQHAKAMAVKLCVVALLCSQFISSRYNLLISTVPFCVLTLLVGLSSRFSLKLLSRLGDVSYGTYLWGFFVQQLIVWSLNGAITPIVLAAVSLPVSWLLGALSWHLVEQPALRLKPRSASALPPQQVPIDRRATMRPSEPPMPPPSRLAQQ